MAASKAIIDIPSFATTQLALLETELQSEVAETASLISNSTPTALQRAGLAVTNLSLGSQRTGMGGRTVVEFIPDSVGLVAFLSVLCTYLIWYGGVVEG